MRIVVNGKGELFAKPHRQSANLVSVVYPYRYQSSRVRFIG